MWCVGGEDPPGQCPPTATPGCCRRTSQGFHRRCRTLSLPTTPAPAQCQRQQGLQDAQLSPVLRGGTSCGYHCNGPPAQEEDTSPFTKHGRGQRRQHSFQAGGEPGLSAPRLILSRVVTFQRTGKCSFYEDPRCGVGAVPPPVLRCSRGSQVSASSPSLRSTVLSLRFTAGRIRLSRKRPSAPRLPCPPEEGRAPAHAKAAAPRRRGHAEGPDSSVCSDAATLH